MIKTASGGDSAAEIALFTSARSCLYRPLNNHHLDKLLHPFREELLARLAAPFDDFYLEDWELAHRDGKSYKAYLFLDALYIPSEQRRAITEKIENSGAFALWLGQAGGYDENGPAPVFAKGLDAIPTEQALREQLTAAGVHFYSEVDDLVFVNDRTIVLTSQSDGPRALRLPEPAMLRDALSGETFGPAADIELDLKRFETRIFERSKS